jgi:hypothetical protein
MKNRHKVALGLFIALLSLAIVVNLPLINTGVTETDCNQGNCSSHAVYQSIAQEGCFYGCMITCCVATITLEYATLSSGTATTPTSRGTANLFIGFNNPGSTTKIISFNIPDSNITVYQCPSPSSCEVVSTPTIAANSITGFNTTATAYYFSMSIISNGTYNYVVAFANGQSVSGTLTAK